MSSAEQLAQRRQQLVSESTRLRTELSQQGQVLRQQLAHVDLGMSLLMRIRQQPWILAGLAAGMIIFKPQRLWVRTQAVLGLYNTAQRLLPILLPLLQGWWNKRQNKS